MKKVPIISCEEAASMVKDGDRLLGGGFGMTGHPIHLLHALAQTKTKNLTFIGNNVGESNLGGGRLLNNGQLRKIIGSFFTSNPDAVKAAQEHKVEYELRPQGTLAEAIRAGGAGIPAFFTPASAGTVLSEGKEFREFEGINYVLEKSIKADVAFIRAWKADTAGNLTYRMTEQNFNKAMAMAGNLVIAEVEEIVPVGSIDPNFIHTPGCFIDYLVQAHTSLAELGSSGSGVVGSKKVNELRMNIANRAFKELSKGDIVNLGIGIPTLVADLIKEEHEIIIHTENGMVGVGPSPTDGGGAMNYPVNAGKIPVTALPGSSYFDSSESFAMIRGGHIDVAIMGGLQVDQFGNLANWAVPGKPLLGVGGAMDLASGAKKLIITMMHANRDGSSKMVEKCSLPLTSHAAVHLVITELGVFKFMNSEMVLVELMPGSTLDEVKQKTEAKFKISL